VVPYAELHCHSNASFLDGGSHPEELAEEAAHLRLEALAITDHDGMYGIVRFAEAARALGLPTIFGAELTLVPGPAGPRGPGGRSRDRPGRQHGVQRTGTPAQAGASGGAGAGPEGMRDCAGRLGGADGRGQGARGLGGWPGCTAATGRC
jgi:hypothetical protein